MDTADETINYIAAFSQYHQYYHRPTATPISQLYSPTAREHTTSDLRVEACTADSDTATTSAPNASSPSVVSTLPPGAPLSDTPDDPYTFILTHQYYNKK